MEEDSSGNYTDMEKLTKFSVSAALCQWIDLQECPELIKLKRYLSLTKWSQKDVDTCLSGISQILLCHQYLISKEFIQLFGTIFIELLERAARVNIDVESKHKLMCVLLGKLVTQNKSVLK